MPRWALPKVGARVGRCQPLVGAQVKAEASCWAARAPLLVRVSQCALCAATRRANPGDARRLQDGVELALDHRSSSHSPAGAWLPAAAGGGPPTPAWGGLPALAQAPGPYQQAPYCQDLPPGQGVGGTDDIQRLLQALKSGLPPPLQRHSAPAPSDVWHHQHHHQQEQHAAAAAASMAGGPSLPIDSSADCSTLTHASMGAEYGLGDNGRWAAAGAGGTCRAGWLPRLLPPMKADDRGRPQTGPGRIYLFIQAAALCHSVVGPWIHDTSSVPAFAVQQEEAPGWAWIQLCLSACAAGTCPGRRRKTALRSQQPRAARAPGRCTRTRCARCSRGSRHPATRLHSCLGT